MTLNEAREEPLQCELGLWLRTFPTVSNVKFMMVDDKEYIVIAEVKLYLLLYHLYCYHVLHPPPSPSPSRAFLATHST